MSGTEIALLVVAVVLALVVIGLVVAMMRQRKLKDRFGPEYERTVDEAGSRRAAEKELSSREQRHEALDIRPLDEESRQSYAQAWRETQERFVDSPQLAIVDADHLIGQVMLARGYPTGDFDQQARDLSVEHARVVDHYRAAHEVYEHSEHGEATTEDLRGAMVHYRALFADLVESPQLSSR